MELVVAQVVAVLGKYALDKGDDLLKEAGKTAADAWHELYDAVIGRLKDDPATTVIADGFDAKPDSYAQPVEDVLTKQLEADPELAAKLSALMARLEAATPPATYSAMVSGSGAAAIGQGNIAVGQGGTVADDGSIIVSGGTLSGDVGKPREEVPP